MNHTEAQEAILFFGRGARIVKQMMYMEFEAVLDNVVGLEDFADQTVRAVYIEVNGYLEIEACVAFTVSFDSEGHADPNWNVPLRRMAYQSTKSILYRESNIRVFTKSQNSQASYNNYLWDFEALCSPSALLEALYLALELNTLGLIGERREQARPTQATAASAQPLIEPPTVTQQPSETSAANEKYSKEFSEYKLQNERLINELQLQIERLKGKLKSTLVENKALKNHSKEQGEALHRLRNIIEDKLPRMKKNNQKVLQELKARHADEQTEWLEKQAKTLSEKEDAVQNLTEELCTLRRDKMRLMMNGTDNFLEKIAESGLKMVAFQPGAGHLTISLDELNDYINDPYAYVAKKCGVTTETYSDWREHIKNPVCRFLVKGEPCCGARITPVSDPKQYQPGVSDRCLKHRSAVSVARMQQQAQGDSSNPPNPPTDPKALNG